VQIFFKKQFIQFKMNVPGILTQNKIHPMTQLRSQLDEIDQSLLQLLARRMQVAQQIGTYKKENNIPILQAGRWNELLQAVIVKGEQWDLSADCIKQIFTAIHDESIRHQSNV
jgi:chorismate mutase